MATKRTTPKKRTTTKRTTTKRNPGQFKKGSQRAKAAGRKGGKAAAGTRTHRRKRAQGRHK